MAVRIFLTLASLAALTSSWSGVKLGVGNFSDANSIVAIVVGLGVAVYERKALHLRGWMFLPAMVAFLFLAKNVIVDGASLGGDGSGAVAPSLFFSRVVLSTSAVALMLGLMLAVGGTRSLTRLLAGWSIGVVVSAGFALLQAKGVRLTIPGLQQTVSQINERYPGLSSHPNALAQSCGIVLPVLFFFVFQMRGVGRAIPLVGVVVVTAAVYASGSRAGLLLALVAIAGSIVLRLMLSRRRWLLIVLFPILVPVTLWIVPQAIEGTRLSGDIGGAQLSDAGRISAISAGWQMFAENPIFGTRLGFWYGELSLLVILVGGGIVLALAYAAFVLSPIFALWRVWRQPIAATALLCSAMIVGFALLNNGMFERVVFWPTLTAWFFVTAGNRGRPAIR